MANLLWEANDWNSIMDIKYLDVCEVELNNLVIGDIIIVSICSCQSAFIVFSIGSNSIVCENSDLIYRISDKEGIYAWKKWNKYLIEII